MKQPTIYDNLIRKLGRKPTYQEIKDEVMRILQSQIYGRFDDRVEAGKLSHQRKGKKF